MHPMSEYVYNSHSLNRGLTGDNFLKFLLAARILPSGGLRCTNNKQRTPHNHKDLLGQSVNQSSEFLAYQETFYVSKDSFIQNELCTSEENKIIRRKSEQMHIVPKINKSSNRNANAASLSTVVGLEIQNSKNLQTKILAVERLNLIQRYCRGLNKATHSIFSQDHRHIIYPESKYAFSTIVSLKTQFHLQSL